MHKERSQADSDVPAIPAVGADGGTLAWVKQFTRPMRCRPTHFILDEFDSDYFLIFDFSEDPETPEAAGTCDILIAPLLADDKLAESWRLVANADRHGVMRLLAALGVNRFNAKTKDAYYQLSNPLRSALSTATQ